MVMRLGRAKRLWSETFFDGTHRRLPFAIPSRSPYRAGCPNVVNVLKSFVESSPTLRRLGSREPGSASMSASRSTPDLSPPGADVCF